MSRRIPPPAVLLSTPDDVEAQFYEALLRGDIERLMAVWADDEEIVCIHPGGARMIGAAAIRASFEAVFATGGLRLRPEQQHRLQQPGFAMHHLVERIDVDTEQGPQSAWVLATNVYVKTAQGWRLAAHHASPGLAPDVSVSAGPPDAGGERPSTLH
jgi:uncharacterized protein (TIGR02246 family)